MRAFCGFRVGCFVMYCTIAVCIQFVEAISAALVFPRGSDCGGSVLLLGLIRVAGVFCSIVVLLWLPLCGVSGG